MNILNEGSPEFLKHVVTLLAYERVSGKVNIWNASGFMVEVKKRYWLVTAGHYLKHVLDINSAGRLTQFLAFDAWSDSMGQGRPVVLPRDPRRWLVIGDADTLDYGAIEIGPLVAANLKAGLIEAVTEAHRQSTPATFDFYLLLGIPTEFVKTGVPVGEIPLAYDIARAFIEVEKITRPPDAKATTHDRFYGQLNRADVEGAKKVKDIGGVSGGPILGCKRTSEGVDFRIIANQSGWNSETKVITADYLFPLIEELRRRG